VSAGRIRSSRGAWAIVGALSVTETHDALLWTLVALSAVAAALAYRAELQARYQLCPAALAAARGRRSTRIDRRSSLRSKR
jgi:hypothetical protein